MQHELKINKPEEILEVQKALESGTKSARDYSFGDDIVTKVFLDPDSFNSDGSIITKISGHGSVVRPDEKYDSTHNRVDASVIIRDCHKQIALDFDIYEETSFESKIAKLDTLIDTLIQFREDLIQKFDFAGAIDKILAEQKSLDTANGTVVVGSKPDEEDSRD